MLFKKIIFVLNLTCERLIKFIQLIRKCGYNMHLKIDFKRLVVGISFIVISFETLAAHVANTVILVYGDSLSAAYGIAQEQGWVTLLQQRILQQKPNYLVVNASISGETTSGGLSRLEKALKQYQPTLILIELGANDALRGLPIAEIRKNLEAMITISKKNKSKVILLGMKIPPNYGIKYTRNFQESYQILATQYKLPFVPFLLDGVAGNRELNQEDGLHPLAKAEPVVLNNVWRVVKEVIK